VKPLQPLTKVVVVLIRIHVALTVVAIAVGLLALILLLAAPGVSSALVVDGLTVIVGILQVVLGLAFVVTFLVWLHRLSTNLHAYSGVRLEHSPGWAVGWFFVPVANLFKPYQVMKEVWRVSHGTRAVGAAPVGWWWALYLASGFLGRLSSTLSTRAASYGIEGTPIPTLAFLFSDLNDLALNIVLLLMVSRIAAAYAVNIREGTVASESQPPQGWFADPFHRHELRYWDGAQWTRWVSSGGQSALEESR
jgi:hypothetical protein